mgnify:CR=1 FL=1
MFRTHTCGELRISDVNKQVTLSGWVQRSRKMGGMTFIDLRDRYGITQLVFNEEVNAELCEQANKLGREFVIQITGVVNERFSKNSNIPTGDIEIIVSELNILNAAVTPPFTIEDNTDVQTIDVTKLRKILKDNPYLDGSTPEILVDDSDIDKIERSGHWQKSFGAHYKNSFLKSANQKNNSSFTFIPVIKKAGTYEVFFYCTALPDQEMPEVMAFDITSKEGTKQAEISPRSHKGSWVSLGTYAFEKGNWTSSVKIDGSRSKGTLFADAIILVPKK